MTRAARIALIVVGVIAVLIVLAFSMLIAGGASEATVEGGRVWAVSPVELAVPDVGPVETTAPAAGEHQLVIAYPNVADIVTSPLTIEGVATASQLGYRLFGGGMPLAEGTIVVDGEGRFSTTVEFSNTCCIELTLEVFDMQPDAGLGVTIPLAYPETS